MNTAVVSSIGAVNTTLFNNGTGADQKKAIESDDPRLSFSADITNAQSLTLTASAADPARPAAPVWFGNLVVNCAF